MVPSETESVARLGSVDWLVGRTRYCVEPQGIDAVPVVGGTKDVDADLVRRLKPDLVLANKEENARRTVETLIREGLPVHVSFPRTVPDSLSYLRSLSTMLGVSSSLVHEAVDRAVARCDGDVAPIRVFVPIWRDPWMTFDGRVFASDLLSLVGGENIFSDRRRRYPLAADLGRGPAAAEQRMAERDTRYPRITLAEVVEREPDLILLPDEPYEFTEADGTELESLGTGAKVVSVSGQDLFWYGVRLASSIDSLRQLLRAHRDDG